MLTRTIFVGSSVLSVGMVGYLASITKLHTTTHPAPTTTAPVTSTTVTPAGATGATAAPTTTTVPVTTTTTCYTTPSGNTVCN